MRRTYLLCAGLFFLQSFVTPVHANQYQHVGNPIATVFSVEEHQSGNQIWSAKRYIDGRMLFATGNGLTSWDGENWQRSSTPNNTRIRDITVWHDDRIYAGAVGELGYFSQTNTGEFSFTHLPTHHLLADFGQTLGVNSNSEMVVFSTQQAILVWDGKQIQALTPSNIKGTRVFKVGDTLMFDDMHTMYAIELLNGKPTAKPLTWQFPSNIRIKSVFTNQQNKIIMVTNTQGVFQLENDTFVSVIAANELPAQRINSGIQGQDGFYYLNSAIDGLMIFDESFALMRHYKQNDGLGIATIYNVFQDEQQNIWLMGLPNIVVFQPPHLRSQYASDTNTVDFENIYNIDRTMFFSGTGLYQLTFANGKTRSPVFTQIPNFNLVVMDLVVIKNELFVGTEAGVYRFNLKWENEHAVISNPRLISNQYWVTELVLSPDKQFLFATIGNYLSQFEKIKGQWRETPLFEDKTGMENLSIQVINDRLQYLWVTTEQQELYRITRVDKQVELASLLKFDKDSAPLGNEHLRPFSYMQRALIGTQNGLVEYDPTNTPELTLVNDFPKAFRTPNKDIFKIEIDDKHRIWYHAGRDTGVLYNDDAGLLVEHETLFKPYNRSGTRGLSYFDKAIWMGVANGGVYRFSEDAIENIPKAAPLSIQYINSINGDTRLPLNMAQSAISVDNNSIRLGFALADFSSPTKTLYRTHLAGLAKPLWSQWSTETSKDFTMLPGGHYTLSLEAKDAWGRISSTQYPFSIAYPWYATFWAKLIYLLMFLLVIGASIKVGQKMRNRALEQQNQNLELGIIDRTQKIALKVDELKQQQILKDRFFSNVSHEFRTPLTLTIGPLETILKECSEQINSKVKNLTFTALNNAKTMLALVGQVLDVNRLEVGQLALRVSQHDIAALIRTNHERFLPWAEQHQQELVMLNCENPHNIYCDLDQIDKCLSNLLSNAIKYSGKHSKITIELIHQQQQLSICISDNGHGIHPSHKAQVFERYYQEELNEGESSTGTGIGLALVKELIDLHHGSITLETEIDCGCLFTIGLPHGNSHFTDAQLVEASIMHETGTIDDGVTDTAEKDRASILVVDDNAELRQFICQRLVNSFTVIEADNGESGYVSALKHLPDIIISDITMPVMSGLQLTKQIKAHPELKHIPILLLSAQTLKRDIVQGFASGADDYLTKPFDTSELVMRVNTLIKSRKTIARQKIQMAAELNEALSNSNSFEDTLQQHIFSHLHETEFTIDSLSQLMFMSKETLRRKCQVSFQTSPSAHIQVVRLQQAKLLLEQHKMNVSEVAYAVGFDSLSYFSKAFKKHYGLSPSALH